MSNVCAGAPQWAVDPNDVGPDVPPVGRSLFDFLATVERNGKREYDVPFPYAAFIARVEQRLQGTNVTTPRLKQVLIPLGRSLQRNAAAPDFFGFPRVVSVVDTEAGARGDRSMLLKDRVYIGYGEKSAILEIISYNEAAARFEFQVVNDYRPGGASQVAYANRAVCMSCHQNAAPIFSRQTWSETNANPEIAARLLQKGKTFHGVPVERGVDVPFAIDAAAERANLFAVTQRVWREGCGDGAVGARCRAALFIAALQYRMSGERGFDTQSAHYQNDFRAVLLARWRERWPNGLYVPSSSIPNRDPLRAANTGATTVALNVALDAKGKKLLQDLIANTDIAAPFEPLNPRAPLETWSASDPDLPARVVHGVADFIAAQDAQRVDATLRERIGFSPAKTLRATCEFQSRKLDARDQRMAFECRAAAPSDLAVTGRFYLREDQVSSITVESIRVRDFELRGLSAVAVRVPGANAMNVALARDGARVRAPDGGALSDLVLSWNGALHGDGVLRGTAMLTHYDDFERVRRVVEGVANDAGTDAFTTAPLRRVAVMSAVLEKLNAEVGPWCCLDDHGMPPALDDRLLPVVMRN